MFLWFSDSCVLCYVLLQCFSCVERPRPVSPMLGGVRRFSHLSDGVFFMGYSSVKAREVSEDVKTPGCGEHTGGLVVKKITSSDGCIEGRHLCEQMFSVCLSGQVLDIACQLASVVSSCWFDRTVCIPLGKI